MDKVDNSASSHIFNHIGPVLGLFAKEPVAGKVKTRLSPSLSPEQACRLYQTSLRETVSRLLAAGLPLVICYAGRRDWFSAEFPDVPLLAQSGEGLGDRLSNATKELFASGAGPVLLAGSDSPDLPIERVHQVLEALEEKDVVTIPCRDGGYVALGLRQPIMDVFVGIPWSTDKVLEATRQRSAAGGLAYFETEYWDDFDQLEDLRELVSRSPNTETARHIVKELQNLL